MKTFSLKAAEIKKDWVLFDAEDVILGRLAADIAVRLRGKHKPEFTPNMDCGDHVIVINAEKVALSGRKRERKVYYRHTGYPGGIRTRRAGEMLAGSRPEEVLFRAVKNMLPGGVLSHRQLRHLYIYAGGEHPHGAQRPERIDFATQNRHNHLMS